MHKILMYEKELKLNMFNIKRLQLMESNAAIEKEMRGLLMQRSNLKDILIDSYRKELIEREKDREYIAG